MDYGKIIERFMAMDDATWARHANPWSGWTRMPVLALLALAIWSRVWIGWWALLPITLLIVWIWINTRIFPEPNSTDNWMSRAVLGERVWLARKQIPIAAHHARAAKLLNLSAVTGLPFLIYGLVYLSPWPTVFGVFLVTFFKLWFLDRMVWLYRETHVDV